jgi:hypothetical protein
MKVHELEVIARSGRLGSLYELTDCGFYDILAGFGLSFV